jgi:mannose-6-phosphate isomerase-like protein (cupin superfamily)
VTDLIHRRSGDPSRVQQLGPYAIEALLTREEARAGTVYRVRIEPRCRTSISYHRVAEEYYFVLSGSGIALLGGEGFRIGPGDFLRLPPGTTHGFVTDAEPLEMLDIHTPGCYPDHDTYFVDETPAGITSG